MMDTEELFSVFETQRKPRYNNQEPATPDVEWNDIEAGNEVTTFGSGSKVCNYELCLPSDYTAELKPISLEDTFEPAKTYPFELDPFQKVQQEQTTSNPQGFYKLSRKTKLSAGVSPHVCRKDGCC